jgi:protein gp37
MSDKTKIEWADATCNPINGCTPISPGCTHCYAMKQAHRFPIRRGLTAPSKGGMVWTGEVRFERDQLIKPLGWKRPRRIFWNAHGDLFHESVPDDWIDQVFAVCALTPQHTHMILTKRSARMRDYLTGPHVFRIADEVQELSAAGWPRTQAQSSISSMMPLSNVWLGVSVEDQTRADERIPDLLATPAAVRFISAEPLLGPVDLTYLDFESGTAIIDAMAGRHGVMVPLGGTNAKIDWVIAGGESGPDARPMHPDWARSLRDQCAAAGVAFHFKQWGERAWSERIEGDPSTLTAYRAGKKAAGRLLDGVEHNGMPA